MAKTDNQKEVLVEEIPTMNVVEKEQEEKPEMDQRMDVGAYKKMLENNTSVLKREYEQLEYLVKLAKLRIEYKQLLEAQK